MQQLAQEYIAPLRQKYEQEYEAFQHKLLQAAAKQQGQLGIRYQFEDSSECSASTVESISSDEEQEEEETQ